MQYFFCWSSPSVISIRLCIIIGLITQNLIKRLYELAVISGFQNGYVALQTDVYTYVSKDAEMSFFNMTT
jgi:hypothetical protein